MYIGSFQLWEGKAAQLNSIFRDIQFMVSLEMSSMKYKGSQTQSKDLKKNSGLWERLIYVKWLQFLLSFIMMDFFGCVCLCIFFPFFQSHLTGTLQTPANLSIQWDGKVQLLHPMHLKPSATHLSQMYIRRLARWTVSYKWLSFKLNHPHCKELCTI